MKTRGFWFRVCQVGPSSARHFRRTAGRRSQFSHQLTDGANIMTWRSAHPRRGFDEPSSGWRGVASRYRRVSVSDGRLKRITKTIRKKTCPLSLRMKSIPVYWTVRVDGYAMRRAIVRAMKSVRRRRVDPARRRGSFNVVCPSSVNFVAAIVVLDRRGRVGTNVMSASYVGD